MYGAVSATSRRLGVRQAPRGGVSGFESVPPSGTGPMRVVANGSPAPGASLQRESRRKLASTCAASVSPASFLAPVQAAAGSQAAPSLPGTQTQPPSAGEAGQSASVGPGSPACGTPMLWNFPSESRGPLWQSTQEALPTN